MPVLSAPRAENKRIFRPPERLSADFMAETRVPGAMQRSSRCFAEPGPYQTPAPFTAPALQRTTPLKKRHAALRPGNGPSLTRLLLPLPQRAFLGDRGHQGAVG